MAFTFTPAEEAELFPLCSPEADVSHVLRNRRMRTVQTRALDYLYPKLPPYFQRNFVQFLRNVRDVLGGSLLMYDNHAGGSAEPKAARPVNGWTEELQKRCPVQLAPQASFASSLAPTLQPLTDGGAMQTEFNAPYIDVLFPYDAVNTSLEKEEAAQRPTTDDVEPAASSASQDVVPSSAWPAPRKKFVTKGEAVATETNTVWIKRDEMSGALKHVGKVFVPSAPASADGNNPPSVVGSISFQAKDWHPLNLLVASEKPKTSSGNPTADGGAGAGGELLSAPSASPSPARGDMSGSPKPSGLGNASMPSAHHHHHHHHASASSMMQQKQTPPQVTAWVFHVAFRSYDEENFIRISVEPSEKLLASPLAKELLVANNQQQQQQQQQKTDKKDTLEICSGVIAVRHCVVHRVILLSTGHLLLADAVRHKIFGRLTIPPEIVAELSNANENGTLPVRASAFSFPTGSPLSPNEEASNNVGGGSGSGAALAAARERTRQFFENVAVTFRGVAPNTPTRFMGLGVVMMDSTIHTFQHACDADCPLSWNDILYPELYSRTP